MKYKEYDDVYLEFDRYAAGTMCIEMFSEDEGHITNVDDSFTTPELINSNLVAILEGNAHLSDWLCENDIAVFAGVYFRSVNTPDGAAIWHYRILKIVEENKYKSERARLLTSHCYVCHEKVLRDTMQMVEDMYGIPRGLACDNCFDKADAELKRWKFDPADAGESLEEDDD